MPIVMPRPMQQRVLQLVTNFSNPENLILKLYKNDYTPVETSVVASFTEADFIGYSSVQLTPANWGYTQGDPTVALYSTPVEFVSSAGSQNQQIYGYFVVGSTSGLLMFAERFSVTPGPLMNNQAKITVYPRVSLDL